MARGRSLPLLADEAIRLVPLTRDHEPDVARLVQDDAVRRHTRVPTHPSAGFAREWIRVYEDGWRGRTRAGFAIESQQRAFLGLGLFVKIEEEARQGEIGYIVSPAARGRGVATRALELLTEWGFSELGLVADRALDRHDQPCLGACRRARRLRARGGASLVFPQGGSPTRLRNLVADSRVENAGECEAGAAASEANR